MFYQEHGKQFRRKHLENRKQMALEEEDEDAFKKISAIIHREHQLNFWCKLNYATGKKKTCSASLYKSKVRTVPSWSKQHRTQWNKPSSQKYTRNGTRWQERH
jgi:hypothetical protein